MWESIKAFYPGSTANWDHEPPLIWGHILSDLSVDQLANGVLNLVHHRDSRGHNEFPPNAGQFRDLCLTNFQWETRAHRVVDSSRMLEDATGKESNRVERQAQLKALRQRTGL